ncbi:MAG: hypothetical protein ABIK89_25575 [Planctomycetota bacterium]
MKRTWVIAGVAAAGLILAPFIVPIFAPWSGINCQHQDINIKTGQARYSRCLWFVAVSEQVKETALSVAMQGEVLDVADIEPWQRVNTFSPGVQVSPHYRFHSAFAQAKQLEGAFLMLELGTEDKRAIAREVLRLWQTSGTAYGADTVIQRVWEQRVASRRGQATR